MPDLGILFTGKYLASADLEGRRVTLTIQEIRRESIGDEDAAKPRDKPRDKWVIYFVGKSKGMVLNRTNKMIIQLIYKTQMTEDLIGKQITIAAVPVRLGPDHVDGIRIVGAPTLEAPIDEVLQVSRKRKERVRLEPTK